MKKSELHYAFHVSIELVRDDIIEFFLGKFSWEGDSYPYRVYLITFELVVDGRVIGRTEPVLLYPNANLTICIARDLELPKGVVALLRGRGPSWRYPQLALSEEHETNASAVLRPVT